MTAIILENKTALFGVRHVQIFLLFMCGSIAYFIRINVSVAVVAMTNKDTTNPDFEEFPWEEQERNTILSSFFFGYMFSQLPGGWLAQRYGAKYLLLSATLVPSLLSLITPISVKYGGWEVFCAIRILEGIFQGVIFPSFHTFLAKWIPLSERNVLGSLTHSGIEFGTILAFSASGFIAASPLGWPGISYVTGGLGLIWSAVWLYYGASTPMESRIISLEEKKFIEASLHAANEVSKKHLKTPWKEICTSTPFWALMMARLSQAWGFTITLTQIPTYLNKILKMDIQSNAIFSAIPYIIMLVVGVTFIVITNFLSKKNVSLELIRKSLNTIAFWIPAASILALGFVPADQATLAIALLSITVGSNGTQNLGSTLNHIDLAPNHAGVLMGLTNTLSSAIGVICPIITAQIINDAQDQSQWRTMFIITSITYFTGNLLYIIFGKAKAQPWNEMKDIDSNCDTTKNIEKGST